MIDAKKLAKELPKKYDNLSQHEREEIVFLLYKIAKVSFNHFVQSLKGEATKVKEE